MAYAIICTVWDVQNAAVVTSEQFLGARTVRLLVSFDLQSAYGLHLSLVPSVMAEMMK